jgi:hypothetical protein
VQKVAHSSDEFLCDVRAAGSVVVRLAARRSAERRHRAVSLIRGPQHVQRVLQVTGTESLFTFVAAEGGG